MFLASFMKRLERVIENTYMWIISFSLWLSAQIKIFCLNINNQLIPYHRSKLRKKDTRIEIIEPNQNYISNNINNVPLDLEALQIQYKQVQKELDQITDKQSAITWLLSKQDNIRDINHLLQIDDILIWLIS